MGKDKVTDHWALRTSVPGRTSKIFGSIPAVAGPGAQSPPQEGSKGLSAEPSNRQPAPQILPEMEPGRSGGNLLRGPVGSENAWVRPLSLTGGEPCPRRPRKEVRRRLRPGPARPGVPRPEWLARPGPCRRRPGPPPGGGASWGGQVPGGRGRRHPADGGICAAEAVVGGRGDGGAGTGGPADRGRRRPAPGRRPSGGGAGGRDRYGGGGRVGRRKNPWAGGGRAFRPLGAARRRAMEGGRGRLGSGRDLALWDRIVSRHWGPGRGTAGRAPRGAPQFKPRWAALES